MSTIYPPQRRKIAPSSHHTQAPHRKTAKAHRLISPRGDLLQEVGLALALGAAEAQRLKKSGTIARGPWNTRYPAS